MRRLDNFINRCGQMMAFCFLALVYFIPISIALTEAFSGLAIICYLLKRGGIFLTRWQWQPPQSIAAAILRTVKIFLLSFKPKDNCLNKPFALFMFISFVTIFTSHHHDVSFRGFLGKILQGVFIFFSFMECMTSTKRLKVFLITFFISISLVCFNGLYQYFVGYEFIRGHIFDGRISSSLRQANDFAAYLVVVTPVLFCLVVSKIFISRRNGYMQNADLSFLSNPRTQVAIFVLFLMSVINLGFTYSRGAWVGFALCLFLLGFGGKRPVIASILVAVIFSIVFYPQFNEVRLSVHRPSAQGLKSVPESPLVQAPVQDGPEWQKNPGIMGFGPGMAFKIYNNRLGYWSRSMQIIRDYPLLGTGINTYSVVQWEYNEGWGGYPHNSYLQMTAETGVLGLLSFLWLLFVLYKNFFKAVRKMQESNLKLLLIGFGAGLSGFLLHSFFDTNFYSVQLSSLMWLIIGVVVAIQHMGANEGLALPKR